MQTKKVYMFHSVSWQTYFIAFALVAGFYYLAMLFLFFKKEAKQLFTKVRNSDGKHTVNRSNGLEEVTTGYDNDYAIYQSLRNETEAFLETAEPDVFKSDILFSLVTIIKRHPALEDERFKEALNKEIRRMYLQKYNDGITEEELVALWQV